MNYRYSHEILAFGLLILDGGVGTMRAENITHVVPEQPFYYSDTLILQSHNIDINNDHIADFNLFSPNGIGIHLDPLNNSSILTDKNGYIYSLAQGSTISSDMNPVFVWQAPNSPDGSPTIVASVDIGSVGYFKDSTDAYAGIQLEIEGQLHYGWMHIKNQFSNIGEISDWAYENNPNTPILAGSIPEPSSIALFAVGAAAMSLWIKRKKRT